MSAQKKITLLERTLDRIERGKYCQLTLGWCSDTISWLWKWRHISREQMERFCDKVIFLMETYPEYL